MHDAHRGPSFLRRLSPADAARLGLPALADGKVADGAMDAIAFVEGLLANEADELALWLREQGFQAIEVSRKEDSFRVSWTK